ncbi:cyclase family protein [Peredibacter sp. HCB2-198]|uniref:cyclase family protein n=1 Tax=Peredibacter sp. HCB2-198 TaxID=3383025 RepID=UPI0038B6099F
MKYSKLLIFSGILSTSLLASAETNWYPSKFGAQDQIGAANYLSPEITKDAARLVTTGKSYSLGVDVNKDIPAFRHRSFKLYMTQPSQQAGQTEGKNKFTFNDELIETWLGVGTQINGLGHIGIDNVYYNGHKAKDIVTMTGLTKLGLEHTPPIATRGVVLDMTAHFKSKIVKEGTVFTVKDIEEVLKKQRVEIRKGDVVLFHTGWLNLVGKDNDRFLKGEPGIHLEAAQYLIDKGVVAIGSDTWALEAVPAPKGAGVFEVNQLLIPKNGVYVLELINSAELIKDKAFEFFFVLGQPKYTGTSQSIINPIAIR